MPFPPHLIFSFIFRLFDWSRKIEGVKNGVRMDPIQHFLIKRDRMWWAELSESMPSIPSAAASLGGVQKLALEEKEDKRWAFVFLWYSSTFSFLPLLLTEGRRKYSFPSLSVQSCWCNYFLICFFPWTWMTEEGPREWTPATFSSFHATHSRWPTSLFIFSERRLLLEQN